MHAQCPCHKDKAKHSNKAAARQMIIGVSSWYVEDFSLSLRELIPKVYSSCRQTSSYSLPLCRSKFNAQVLPEGSCTHIPPPKGNTWKSSNPACTEGAADTHHGGTPEEKVPLDVDIPSKSSSVMFRNGDCKLIAEASPCQDTPCDNSGTQDTNVQVGARFGGVLPSADQVTLPRSIFLEGEIVDIVIGVGRIKRGHEK